MRSTIRKLLNVGRSTRFSANAATNRGRVHSAVLIAVLLVSAGCAGFQPGTETPVRGHLPPIDGHAKFDINANFTGSPAYERQGNVELRLYDSNRTFDDVVLCAYDAEQRPIARASVGSLEGPRDRASYRLTLGQRPDLIIVYHPGFEEYPDLMIDSIIWTGDGYYLRPVYEKTLEDEFPYSADIPAGRCVK